jgi:hypothetical protein
MLEYDCAGLEGLGRFRVRRRSEGRTDTKRCGATIRVRVRVVLHEYLDTDCKAQRSSAGWPCKSFGMDCKSAWMVTSKTERVIDLVGSCSHSIACSGRCHRRGVGMGMGVVVVVVIPRIRLRKCNDDFVESTGDEWRESRERESRCGVASTIAR